MEVVAAAPGAGPVPPYQRRDVEEWSHLDQLTGMLEHARVEKDHWTANTHNSTHQYGKVVDLRDRSAADGKIQQRQRKQLEVFRSQVPGASLQVIRTQTLATSTSRWTSSSQTSTSTAARTTLFDSDTVNSEFENLHLAVNPLDLSSQKTKASVGRSGSIGGRRPPSRPRSIGKIDTEEDITARLQKVSRLCQQIHTSNKGNLSPRPSIYDRQSGDGSVDNFEIESVTSNDKDEKEYEKIINQNGVDSQTPSPIEYHNLIGEEIKDKELEEELEDWRRSRNLIQIESKNKTKQDIETGRRLNTALRGNNVDLEALDQILKSISPGSSGTYSDTSINGEKGEDFIDEIPDKKISKTKRHSFITVESLKEVRGRLRRLSSPIDDFYGYSRKEEDPDDGIASEDNGVMKEKLSMPVSSVGVSRVRSYVYGMETMLGNNRKPVVGTGSLESRTSSKLSGNSVNRSEDWYNRRKSYGFEQVHNQQIDQNNISLHARNKIESSTDSGICRSTEIVLVPSAVKSAQLLNNKYNNNRDINKSDFIEQGDTNGHKQSLQVYNKNGNSTIINVNADKNQVNSYQINRKTEFPSKREEANELINIWNRRATLSSINDRLTNKDSEQITITIPIVSEDSTVTTPTRKLYHRQLSENTSVSIEQVSDSNDLKRHSIAVDESKYVSRNEKYPLQLRRTSLVINDKNDPINFTNDGIDDDNNLQGRKPKKVEFCKTEVHFAAESGRVNIVETDEKPPPTNNFRRKRRNSGLTNPSTEDMNKNGLPVIHFGDTSYEKELFSVPDHDNIQSSDISDFNQESPVDNVVCNSTVTVSSVPVQSEPEMLPKEPENENQPRGILKNKMIKPRPYLLGDNEQIPTKDTNTEDPEDTGKIWGVKLRPVQKEEPPMWKSTVMVQNTSYNIPIIENQEDVYTPNDNIIDVKPSSYDSDSSQTEIQKLLHALHPIRKHSSENAFQTSPVDVRRSSWSVADRVKQVENLRWTENKGYSTKVNFGGGEATVIENDSIKRESQPLWSAQDETHNNDFTSAKTTLQSCIQKAQPDKLPNNLNYNRQPLIKQQTPAVAVRNNAARKLKETTVSSTTRTDKRQIVPTNKTMEMKNDNLSSPMLVGNSIQNARSTRRIETVMQKKEEAYVDNRNKYNNSFNKILVSSYVKNLPNPEKKPVAKKPTPNYYPVTSSPIAKRDSTKKTDFYYNAIRSPKLTKKYVDKSREEARKENKPDLIQHYIDTREYVNLSSVFNDTKNENKNGVNKSRSEIKDVSPVRDERPESPVYENIDDIISSQPSGTERESSIIQELTKAADQILQAVNGYTDDDSTKYSTDDEDDKKNRYRRNSEVLETISESKSWKQSTEVKKQNEIVKNRGRVYRPTSSTSSLESVTKDYKPSMPVRQNRSEKLREERIKKKMNAQNSEISKVTKARRLQRASSREALLQSHGSSSEDLSQNTEVARKPRLVRRTKNQQNTSASDVSKKTTVSQSNYGRKRECEMRRSVDRVPVVGLQEIRHKTAISTIRSTAEKAACREKAIKGKNEDLKKKNATKSSFIRGNITKSQADRATRTASSRESGSTLSAIRTSSGVYVPAYRCNSLVAISRSNSECPCLCS